MKRLPLHRRPFLARRVLEVGGGHAPYAGVTHAVDKFPADDTHRAGALKLAPGIDFREGDLEALPFRPEELPFDFIYVSHVLEHVLDPARAVAQINRAARRGYLETPSPLREQLISLVPLDLARDLHRSFCWSDGAGLHVVPKSTATLGQFCSCGNGRRASAMHAYHRSRREDLEPLLPFAAKSTRLHFRAPLRLTLHPGFPQACGAGHCAYRSVAEVLRWASLPRRVIAARFGRLHRALEEMAAC